MNKKKYPLASSAWDEHEEQAMLDVIRSGDFTMGKKVKEFENTFADYFNGKYAVMVNSGSSANLLAIASLFYKKENPLKRGDEVIVPAVSWATTYHPLQQYGLKCRFVDVDINTLNINIESLKKAITDKTRLILLVNLLGNPNDFDAVKEAIGKRDVMVLEDNCESMGAVYKGKFTGTFGIMGTFSTFFSHHISTMEGGIVLTNNEELYHILLSLRAHGWTRNLPSVNHVSGLKSDNAFEESFKFVLPGYNLRPGELHAAVGIEQLKKLPDILLKRRENAKCFTELLKDNNNFIIQKEIGLSSWFGFSLIIKEESGFDRIAVIRHLEENGVECRPIVSGNFLKNPVLKYFNYTVSGEMKNADLIDKNGFFIGNHHYSCEYEIKRFYKNLNFVK